MILTKKQEEGLRTAVERYNLGEKYTCISGYAGSGKSTLVRFIVEALDVNPDDVVYVAYTGKAANVLKNKGCQNAITAHKLLYRARLMPNGKYKYTPRETLEDEPSVVIVDEVSMLPKTLWDLLCTHKVYIIALGDPMQLPPIDKDQDNHVLDHPHVFLDEIMRQAQESEIIRLSMHVREGKPLRSFQCENKEVMIMRPFEVTDDVKAWADQIICATNQKRRELNNDMRRILGYPADRPVIGDKIINLHNEWDIKSSSGNPLTNGVIGNIIDYNIYEQVYPYTFRKDFTQIPILQLTISGDEPEEQFIDLQGDYNELLTGVPSFSGKDEFKLLRLYKDYPLPLHLNYGYAITCWKAQGSEWGKVLGFEEFFPKIPLDHTQYLYTLITRAQDRLVLVQQ